MIKGCKSEPIHFRVIGDYLPFLNSLFFPPHLCYCLRSQEASMAVRYIVRQEADDMSAWPCTCYAEFGAKNSHWELKCALFLNPRMDKHVDCSA